MAFSVFSFTTTRDLQNLFGGGQERVVFDVSGGPARARLRIYNVSEADDGIYRDGRRRGCLALAVRPYSVANWKNLLKERDGFKFLCLYPIKMANTADTD